MKPSVIFMGSKPGSIVALRLMLQRGWEIAHVVTTPEIQHEWIKGPTLTEEAHRLGLPTLSQADLPTDRSVDFVISYMYRKLVRREVLQLATKGALNFHAGPLPGFGGWAFYNVAILENVREYGCTCHYMDEGFDTGPIIQVNRFPIEPGAQTAVSLERRAQREMVRLFIDFLDLAESGAVLPSIPQDPAQMRYLSKQEFMQLKEIPADADAETIDRYARAFWYPPYECAYIKVGNARAEVVPHCAKVEVAHCLQEDTLTDLQVVADEYDSSVRSNHSVE